MTAAATIISVAALLSLSILGLAFLFTVYRVVVGPTLPDRVLALDMLVAIAIGFIAVMAAETGFTLYIDIAISLGLVGFLATVAFARFILTHGIEERAPPLSLGAIPAGAKRQKSKAPKGQRQKKGKK
jgi:multicomponent Na+:H+ antiporter subunit F